MRLTRALIALATLDAACLALAELATVTARHGVIDRRAAPTAAPRYGAAHRIAIRQDNKDKESSVDENKTKSTSSKTTSDKDSTTSKKPTNTSKSNSKTSSKPTSSDKPTATPDPTPTPDDPPAAQPLTGGAVAGIAVGSAAAVVIVLGAVGYFFWRARRSRSDKHAAMWNAEHAHSPGGLPPQMAGAPPPGGPVYSPVPTSAAAASPGFTPSHGSTLSPATAGAGLKPGESVDGASVRSQDPLWVPGDGARPPPPAAAGGRVVQTHSVELPAVGAEAHGMKAASPPRVELAG